MDSTESLPTRFMGSEHLQKLDASWGLEPVGIPLDGSVAWKGISLMKSYSGSQIWGADGCFGLW